MKISKVLRRSTSVSSKSIAMFRQDLESFCFWLLQDRESSNKEKLNLLRDILEARDWEVSNDDKN
jgi:hypothetical protein